MRKPRVLYLVHEYPKVSETYLHSELQAISQAYKPYVISTQPCALRVHDCVPHEYQREKEAIRDTIQRFAPDVLHTHWIDRHTVMLAELSEELKIPFTVRSHSYDVLRRHRGARHLIYNRGRYSRSLWQLRPYVKKELCLGVLGFPFAIPILRKLGYPKEKLHSTYPAILFDRFYNREPNGESILNMGALIPKKKFEDFVDLANLVPEKTFQLYALTAKKDHFIDQYNRSKGSPVEVMEMVQPSMMPEVYKKSEWLVYTADFQMNEVGWPMAVAEAQASGVGVCMPNLRPDLAEYVGGAGYLYDSITELPEILRGGFPEEKRELGFEQAKRSDINRHLHKLTDLWEAAVPSLKADKNSPKHLRVHRADRPSVSR